MSSIANLNAADAWIETMERLLARQRATLLHLIEIDASPTLLTTAERLLRTMNGALAEARSRRADTAAMLGFSQGTVLTAHQGGLLAIWCTVDDLPWVLARPA